MDERAGLIERAAARLREERIEPSAPTTPARVDAPSVVPAPSRALDRTLVLDRKSLAERGIIMPWTTTARVVEEFRIVKRNLMFPWQLSEYQNRTDRSPRVVMLTSARPREGKTFCSINLALAFAAEDSFITVLIDTDAVRGDSARILGAPAAPGFTDVLAGKCRLEDALIQTDLPNLVFLPPGLHAPHVPELLGGRGPSVVIAEIAERYPQHVIVLDSAPCLASTDPTALAPLAKQVVFVVEAEQTQQTEVEASLNMLSGCQQISLLLNKSPTQSSEHFGSYGYYYRSDNAEAKADDD